MGRVRQAVMLGVLIGCVNVAALGYFAGQAWKTTGSPPPEPVIAETPQPEDCAWARLYPRSITRWCSLIEEYSQRSGLETSLIAALMLEESGGDPQALSRSGAVGLLQVMPRDGAARGFVCQNGPCFASRPTAAELVDPEFNMDYGTRTLASLVKKMGSLRDALKAYGPVGMGYRYADAVLSIQQNYR